MITIRDVAKLAGVSITTVSHVVNATRPVSADAAARVQQAIASLDYQPNAIARGLRTASTRMFGMIVPDNSNPYFAEISRSIEDAAFALGYSVILCNSDEDPAKELAYLELLAKKRVDGIAFVATSNHSDNLPSLRAGGLPVVLVDREVKDGVWDTVLVHNSRGAREAVNYLLGLGHRRIGCISGPCGLNPSSDRVRGYREALRKAGVAADPQWIVEGNFHAEGGYATMKALLAREPQVTAVFACNDMMAVGALRALHEQGRRVPDDLALVGFDNIGLAEYTHPALTTIAQPYAEVGEQVARLLALRASGDTSPPERLRLDPALVVRGSCGACAASDGDAQAKDSAVQQTLAPGCAPTRPASLAGLARRPM